MKAIIKREFKSYFTSIIGWVYLAAFFFVFDFYFWAYNLNYGHPYISYAVSGSTFILLIIMPILTMRSMAEDRRSKTDQLLYTAPISVWKVVVGKFLAMLCVFSIAVGAVCIYPLLMSAFGTVPMGESYVSILGLWLFGLLSLGIGIFISTITESQVIAAILSFGALFLGYMMEAILSLFQSDNWLTTVLGCLSTSSHLDNFSNGLLDMSGVVYYVTGTILFLFLSCQLVQKHRWSVSSKKLKKGVFSGGLIAIGVAAVIAVNFGFSKLPDTVQSVDLTEQKLYSLTDDTKEYLKTVDQDVDIYVLSTEDDTDETVNKTLNRYQDACSHIKVTYIDPSVNANFYSTYTDEAPSSGSLIVVCGDKSKVVDADDLYEYSIDYSTYSQSVSAYDGEGQITSAISYVLGGDTQKVYMIEGHGEQSLDTSFQSALEKLNLDIESLTLLTEDAIPDDAAAVIINGPTEDYSEDDAAKVADYLSNGGKLLVVTTYEATEALPNFDALMDQYGIGISYGVVLEGSVNQYYQYPTYLLPTVNTATQTSGVDGYVMAINSQALTNTKADSDTLTWTDLLTTSDDAYFKDDINSVQTYAKEDGDTDGPFTIAANVTDSETGADITVIGSIAVFDDSVDSYVAGNNMKLFKGIVGEYTDSTGTVSVDAKSYTLDSLTINQAVIWIYAVLVMVVLPVVLIVLGVVIWYRRRKA